MPQPILLLLLQGLADAVQVQAPGIGHLEAALISDCGSSIQPVSQLLFVIFRLL